jgi:hypothetical protein
MTKETCKEDKIPASKGLVVQPTVSKEFNSRGQMDLINMQSLISKSSVCAIFKIIFSADFLNYFIR